MRLRFLGTGTSTGVPQLKCKCAVCQSADPRDNRLRTSALITTEGKNILIDCGPDFREQMLRCGSPDIDAVLITHSHYDHTAGLDDLRPFCGGKYDMQIYGPEETSKELLRRQPYCFGLSSYPGVPRLVMHTVGEENFKIENTGIEVMPLPVTHGNMNICGYRIGNLSYVTDCLIMPESTKEKIKGSHTLIINALRHTKHGSHLSVREALDIIDEVKPEKAYLIHASHQIGLHKDLANILPEGVIQSFDGLEIEIPD